MHLPVLPDVWQEENAQTVPVQHPTIERRRAMLRRLINAKLAKATEEQLRYILIILDNLISDA